MAILEMNAGVVIFFIVIGYLLSSIIIDLITLIIAWFVKFLRIIFNITPKKLLPLDSDAGVSIIIPAYNEEENIEKVIESSFNQTKPPKKVVVINDNSTDGTLEICKKLKSKYKNLTIINQKKNKGKAYNVTYALRKIQLSEFTIVQDADTFLSPTYIEEIIKPFKNRRVMIVTGLSLPIKQKNFFGEIIFNGSIFAYKFFSFRKEAQALRNSISVITGDSAAYRSSFLKSVGGLPQGTQTEDMDIAWIALEKGYRVSYQKKALANSKDASTLKGHWNQITRWYAGGFQNLVKHNKKLLKAKPLLFTTILPIFLDSTIYAISFLSAILALFFYRPFFIGFFISDLLFTLLAIIFIDFKRIVNLVEIYIIKIIWSCAWLYAGFKTFIEYIFGKRYWGGTWNRDSFYKKKKLRIKKEK
jgi:cellulose synthase/poly-beta-1,6-N-acetylglucosamine synthase-like glycosyltransferase